MDGRGRARYARAMAQVSRTLEEEGIQMWLGGDWALRALDESHGHHSREAECYIFAVDAPDARRVLEELGYDVVDTTATLFSTERGSWRIRWQLLWHDERGKIVSYDQHDKPWVWPDNAFPPEAKGTIHDTPVAILDPAAQALQGGQSSSPRQVSYKKGSVEKMKAMIHDRM